MLLNYHRPECQSPNHVGCQDGELWVCYQCGLTLCPNDGCADEYPDLCDSCWAEAQGLRPTGEARAWQLVKSG